MGVSINFRPQACSRHRNRLESGVLGSQRGTHWEAGKKLETQAERLRSRPFTSPPPPLFGRPGGGVCLLLARTADLTNPWGAAPYVTHAESQSELTVLLRRQSLRGGSGAVAGLGEGGRSSL